MSDTEKLVAAVAAVKELHQLAYKAVEPWAAGYRFTGEHCAHDGQHWPCDTARALDPSR